MQNANPQDQTDEDSEFAPQWGDAAPKGGRTVLNRVLREGNNVPLFLGQTFINSLRDVGYSSTTSAVCEHVDNAIQAGATEVRLYFRQSSPKEGGQVDVLVYDNGKGMPSHVLQVAMSFGGSMYYENRSGIGRFGVGMKTAALSMSPVLEVYSWQEANAFYSMTLDVEDIGNSRSNLVLLPEPQLLDTLPSEVSRIFTRPMSFPKDSSRQELIADDEDNLCERLGTSGTIVFIPDCDRLTAKRPQTLVEHATRDMARVYRKAIGSGLRLYINNRIVELFDPTYWMPNARHTQISELTETRSRLINTWPDIPIPIEDGSDVTAPVSVRLYMLPIEAWYGLPRKVQKNDLQIFEDHLVSFVRNGREVHIGTVKELSGGRHGDSAWLRIQVDFNGELDEAFGVAMNKQGVAIDLSHSNETTSFDVLKASARAALITHAGCAAIHPHPRNKSDALLRAVAQKGGVVGIYDLCYLTASPKQPTLDDYMAHMLHALNVCGEDHVGIGSDSALAPWDTSPAAMADFKKDEEHRHKAGVAAPEEDRPLYVIGLNTPRRSEIIADALLKRGYKPRAVEKVLGLNFTDALGRIWGE